jgi:hypothetical protein
MKTYRIFDRSSGGTLPLVWAVCAVLGPVAVGCGDRPGPVSDRPTMAAAAVPDLGGSVAGYSHAFERSLFKPGNGQVAMSDAGYSKLEPFPEPVIIAFAPAETR